MTSHLYFDTRLLMLRARRRAFVRLVMGVVACSCAVASCAFLVGLHGVGA